jgi:hypothetical protein
VGDVDDETEKIQLLILAAVLWENPLAGAFAKKSMERCT